MIDKKSLEIDEKNLIIVLLIGSVIGIVILLVAVTSWGSNDSYILPDVGDVSKTLTQSQVPPPGTPSLEDAGDVFGEGKGIYLGEGDPDPADHPIYSQGFDIVSIKNTLDKMIIRIDWNVDQDFRDVTFFIGITTSNILNEDTALAIDFVDQITEYYTGEAGSPVVHPLEYPELHIYLVEDIISGESYMLLLAVKNWQDSEMYIAN